MTARLLGINHVALEVGDIDEALAWYGRFFAFELRGRAGSSMAFVDMGDQFLALAQRGGQKLRPGSNQVPGLGRCGLRFALTPRRRGLPLRLRELDLAKADALRRHLDALVVADHLERLLERQRPRRDQSHGLVRR